MRIAVEKRITAPLTAGILALELITLARSRAK
jgi:hypothetical protein